MSLLFKYAKQKCFLKKNINSCDFGFDFLCKMSTILANYLLNNRYNINVGWSGPAFGGGIAGEAESVEDGGQELRERRHQGRHLLPVHRLGKPQKKVLFFVVRQLRRGGGVRALTTKEKRFFFLYIFTYFSPKVVEQIFLVKIRFRLFKTKKK